MATDKQRMAKGRSIIARPADYTLIDLETTGYSPAYDRIIELSAVRVRGGEVTDRFSALVNRDGSIVVNPFVTELTGITQTMIDGAPDIADILPGYLDFVGDDVIVGHNVNFDVNFLYDTAMEILSRTFTNDYIDTMRIFRRLHPEHAHHRLADLAERYGIDYTGAHRGERDCIITKLCFDALTKDVVDTYGDFDSFSAAESKSTSHHGVKAGDIAATGTDFDKSHILYGKVCVFTGVLERMTRKEAMQIVANVGGINADSVTKKTNFLILGCNDYCKSIKGGKSSKQKKAEALRLAGQDITILSEDVFYDMID